jgi:hypothetical protein
MGIIDSYKWKLKPQEIGAMAKVKKVVRARKKGPAKQTASAQGANGGAASGKDALAALAEEYKAFKKENPAKAARVPQSIKDQAKKLHDARVTYSAIAEACGITLGSIRAWIEGPAAKAAAAGTFGRGPGRPVQGGMAGLKKGWVTIRVEGRELEVQKGDFWELLKGGIEAAQ